MKLCLMSVLSAKSMSPTGALLIHATILPPFESILGWSVGRIPRFGTSTTPVHVCQQGPLRMVGRDIEATLHHNNSGLTNSSAPGLEPGTNEFAGREQHYTIEPTCAIVSAFTIL
mgnify:CR=1 FL=1